MITKFKIFENVDKDIYYKLFKTIKGVKIYLVDGEKVRNKYDIDYLMGSHHYYNNFIPEDEVWIEKTMSKGDRDAIIKHELHERDLMKNKGMSYTKAHKSATKVEKEFRNIHLNENVKSAKIGDYVIMKSWTTDKNAAALINNSIGQIERIIGPDIAVRYDPDDLEKYGIHFANGITILTKSQIKHISKNKEDLEIYLNTNKYNL